MKTLLLTNLLILSSAMVFAQSESEEFYNAKGNYYNFGKDNLAVQGYDLIEYFKSKTPVKGNPDFSYDHNGITYHFSTQENKETFRANPETYLPQFGGYCAYGVGMEIGEGIGDNKPGKYPINPNSFKIINNKLYLFWSGDNINALDAWNTNEQKFLDNANIHWELMHPKN